MNAFKGQISNCGVQFIQHNNRTICFFVRHDVTIKHNTQINSILKIKKIKKKTLFFNIDDLEIIVINNNKKYV